MWGNRQLKNQGLQTRGQVIGMTSDNRLRQLVLSFGTQGGGGGREIECVKVKGAVAIKGAGGGN